MRLQREHPLFPALLLILAAASWVILIWQSSMMNPLRRARNRRARCALIERLGHVIW